jgi:hypothetical protein
MTKVVSFFPAKRAADNSNSDFSDFYLPAMLIQYLKSSVPDPFHFGTDPDLDPALVSDFQDATKKLIFLSNFFVYYGTFWKYIYIIPQK